MSGKMRASPQTRVISFRPHYHCKVGGLPSKKAESFRERQAKVSLGVIDFPPSSPLLMLQQRETRGGEDFDSWPSLKKEREREREGRRNVTETKNWPS